MTSSATPVGSDMWVFLVTEILFFGGMFTSYMVYRSLHLQAFITGSHLLEVKVRRHQYGCADRQQLDHGSGHSRPLKPARGRADTIFWLILTMLLGATFLFLKFRFEWYHDYVDGIVPGVSWSYHGPYAPGAELFMCFYFFMTGLHALHMIVGIGILTVLIIMTARNKFSPQYYAPLEISGLYWHFVDIVWIFLFPLLYLIGGRYPGS